MRIIVCSILLVAGIAAGAAPVTMAQNIKIKIPAAKEESSKFKVGDKVEVKYSGKWYPGKITSVKSGKYRVDIGIDAAAYKDFAEADIREPQAGGHTAKVGDVVETASAKFKVGDKVEVQLGGAWYAGTIKGATPGKPYRVELKYPPGGFKDINESDIREVVKSTAGSDGQFKVGDVVEAYKAGSWIKVDILKAESRRFFVHWHGYGSDADAWVGKGRLRPVGSDAPYNGEFEVGEKVDVLGRTMWLEATVLEYNPRNRMYKVQETVSGEIWHASENPVRIRAYTGPVVYNFTGKDFKVGQYVRLWYSGNDSIDCQILEVKENQFLINYGGRGPSWIAFDAKELRNDVRAEAMRSSKAMEQTFFQDCSKYIEAIKVFGYLHNEKYGTRFTMFNQGLPAPRPNEVNSLLKEMDELDALIKSKYADIQNTETTWTNELSKNPAHWRTIAERRKELAQSVLTDNLKQQLGKAMKYLGGYEFLKNHDISEFEAGKGVSVLSELQDMLDNNGAAFIKDQEDKVADVIKAAQEANLGQEDIKAFQNFLRTLVADIKSKFDGALPASGFNPSLHDAKAEGVGRQYVQKTYAGAAVLKIGVIHNDFIVVKNNLGVPLNRYKRLGILIRDNKGRCRFLATYYKEDYVGGGAYGSGYIEHYYSYYQKCN